MLRKSINILIVHEHLLFSEGLSKVLATSKDFKAIEIACDSKDALMKFLRLRPDIVIVDIDANSFDGMSIVRRIRDLGIVTKIIICMGHMNENKFHEACVVGIYNYILGNYSIEKLNKTIRDTVICKKSPYTKNKAALEISATDDSIIDLTNREHEILILISEGYNNKVIGKRLFISEKTVKNHITNIFKKINVKNRTEATIYAYKNNIKRL